MEQVSTQQRTHALDGVLKYAYLVNWEAIAYILIFVLAVLTRFVDLGTRVMSHDESLHTKFSWDLYRSGNFSHTPLMHGPLLFHMTAFFYLLFGDSDFSARIYTALIGVLVVMTPILFRRWLGRTGALLASVMFLISPMLMYYSRYIRHDLPAIFFALVMVYAIFQYIDGVDRVRRKPYWLVILAAAMSLLLASKEVGFMYIAIFGSFLTLYWLVRMAQHYFALNNGRTLLYTINAGIMIGVVAALAMIVVFSIIPPTDFDGDGVANAADNCIDVANTGQFDSDGNGVGDDCQAVAAVSLGGRLVTWSLMIVAVVGVALIGTALAARGRADRRFPWQPLILIVLVALLTCTAFLVFEEASRDEPVMSAPADPNAADGISTGVINNTAIVLAWVVGAVVVALAVLGRMMGFWDELKRFPVFDVLIMMGSLILPWLTAIVIYMTGASPTDYSQAGIIRAAVALVPFAAVAVAVGLAWNWRVWLAGAGVFMAIYVFFFTTMFTNGEGLASGMIGSLGYWLEQQGVRRGNQPQYYYILLLAPFYEFLPLIGSAFAGLFGLREMWRRIFRQRAALAEAQAAPVDDSLLDTEEMPELLGGDIEETLTGAANRTVELPALGEDAAQPKRRGPGWLTHAPFLLFVGYWALLNFMAYTLAGEKMPWLTTHLTVPLVLIAGWYGGRIIDGIKLRGFKAHGWQLLALVPLFVIALFQVINPWLVGAYPFQGQARADLLRTGLWLGALAITAGSLYVIVRVVMRIGWGQFWRVAAVSVGLLLALITTRSALMASFINYDYPTEFLVYAHAGPANKTIIEMMREISLRTTDGMNLRVAYDDKMSWPGSWYFREFPQAVFFGSNPSVQVLDDAVAIAVGSEHRAQVEPLLGDRYYHFEYIRLWWPMQDYFNLTVDRIDNVFDFNPANPTSALLRRGLWEIWWNRDYTTYGQATGGNFEITEWPVSDRMHFYVRKDVAAQIWDLGVGAEVISEYETSLTDLWTERSASLVWGGVQGTEPGQFNNPRGVAVGLDGRVYVADSVNHRIQVFNAEGTFLFEWGSFEVGEHGTATGGNFNQPWGIDVGPDGSVYVADTWNHRVQVFTPEGEFIRAWGQLGQLDAAAAPDNFWGPRDVAVDADGLVYVADTGNKRIRVYTAEGEFVRDIGSGGAGAGQLNEPVGLAVHPDGRVFVADTWNRRVQVFNSFGQYLTSWVVSAWYGDQGNRPYLALDPERGHLYVTDPDAARVLVYDFNGSLLGSFGQLGSAESLLDATQFVVIGGIEIDAQGRAFVADAGGARVLRFEPWDEIAVQPLSGDSEGEIIEATEEVTEEMTEEVTEEETVNPLDAPLE